MGDDKEVDWYKYSKFQLNQDLKSGGITQDEYTAELLELNRERKEEQGTIDALPEPQPLVIGKQQERSSYHGLAVANRRRDQRRRRGAFFMLNAKSRLIMGSRMRRCTKR